MLLKLNTELGVINYDFSNSKIIISIGADFLGDWQGGGFDCSYAKGRVPDSGVMSDTFNLNLI
ncbi:MAG: hypothetical protein CM15mP129_02190 [Chloroflexota bacterium]|nr:MAG: hypothetical protein CM15mP129_02190 [Chloroflexota bacterium]